MTTRILSSTLPLALAFGFAASPLLCRAQTAATPADAPATNTTPAPAAPAPAVATPAPADTTTTQASTERPTSYTLAKGDTLASVAKKFDTSIRALAKLNNLSKADYKKLQIGKVLQIPPATTDATSK